MLVILIMDPVIAFITLKTTLSTVSLHMGHKSVIRVKYLSREKSKGEGNETVSKINTTVTIVL